MNYINKIDDIDDEQLKLNKQVEAEAKAENDYLRSVGYIEIKPGMFLAPEEYDKEVRAAKNKKIKNNIFKNPRKKLMEVALFLDIERLQNIVDGKFNFESDDDFDRYWLNFEFLEIIAGESIKCCHDSYCLCCAVSEYLHDGEIKNNCIIADYGQATGLIKKKDSQLCVCPANKITYDNYSAMLNLYKQAYEWYEKNKKEGKK